MVCDGALRFGDGAARRPRSSSSAWPAISPIEAASSSTELAAAVTLLGRGADALLGGARLGRHRVGRAVELGRGDFEPLGRAAHLAERLSTDISNAAIVAAIALAALLALARWLRPASAASRSRSIMLSRNTITVRAMAPISSSAWVAGMRAEVSPAASRFIDAGQAVERPRDAAADQPAEAEADQHRRDADADNDGRGSGVARPSSAAAARAGALLAEAMISSATGIMLLTLNSITATGGATLSVSSIHCANVSL